MAADNIEAIYPLSPVQKAMLLASLGAPASGLYVEKASCKLHGDLNPVEFERAWQIIVDRHEPFRTAFVWKNLSEPLQAVGRRVRVPLKWYDWQARSRAEQESALAALFLQEQERGFNLSKAPLMRVILIKIAEDTHWLLWVHHHLIMDGWSLPRVVSELWEIYEALCKGRDVSLPEVRPYRDYIRWLQQRSLGDAEAYWRRRLKGITAPTRIGRMRKPLSARPEIGDFEITLADELAQSLDQMAKDHRLTLNTIVQGAWALILHGYAGEEDIIFGTTVSGRPADLAGVEAMVGLFINTIPVRVRIEGSLRLDFWLRGIQAEQFAQSQYEYAALPDIHRWSDVAQAVELFESILIFQNYPVQASHQPLAGLEVSEAHPWIRTKYALTLMIMRHSGLVLHLSYNRALFTDSTIERLSRHYAKVLEAIAAAPEARLAELALLSPDEHLGRVRDGNPRPPLSPPPPLPHLHFAAIARSRPQAIALSCGHLHLSFAQLNDQANSLARALVDAGLGPESIAAVCLERSPELLICFLAILKAGAVYLPLDPRFPLARVREICQQAQPRVLITREGLAADLRPMGYPVLEVERAVGQAGRGGVGTEVAAEVSADNAAYVIYTSGSGGRPKGAVLTYGGLRNLVWAQAEVFGRGGEPQRVAMAAPVCFDASIYEMGLSVMQGMCLTIPEREESERGEWLSEHVRREGVTRLVITPTGLGVMSAAGQEGLQELIVCGEKPSEVVLRRWAKGRRIYNAYGPTEASVWATMGEWEEGKKAGVIGRGVSQVEAYVMDGWQRLTAAGVVGELYIGGSGVGRGYVGGGGASAERYVPDGVSGGEGKRLYRTGDMCRYEEGGEIEYVGREDGQVKVRGHRVEVEEVEERMRGYEKVREAAVVVEEDEEGRKRLRGYVVAEAGERVRSEELRRYLQARLPDFMLPATINEVDSLPLSRASSPARDALPEARSSDEMIAPWADETVEGTVARIWARMLDVSEVGLDDNLLEAGGNSLIAMQLLSRICQAFEVELMLGAFLESPTPRALAPKIKAALSQNREVQLPPALPVQKAELVPTSFAQQRLWFANKVQQDDAFNVPVAMRLSGMLLGSVLRAALARLCQRHEALRTRFVEDHGVPFQVIDGAASVPVPLVDLSGLPADAAARCFDAVAQQEARQPFSLENSPLFRVRLIRFADDDHVLLLTMHHIITDLWSVALFFREMIEFYDAISAGREPRLPELTLQYADFACWQRQLLERNLFDPQLSYWAGKLARLRPMPLPQLRRESPAHKAASGEAYSFVMEDLKVGGLRRLAGEEQATLFMVLLTAFKITLRRFAATDDVTVATNVYGRNQTWAEGLIGYFINHLLLRTSLSDDISFRELLSRVRRGALEAYSNQDAPFELVVRALRKGGYGEGNPIQALFALQNTPMPALKMRGLSLTPLRLDTRTARLDLALFVQSNPDSLTGYWTYNAQLYERRAIANFSAYYEIVLDIISRRPDALLSAIQREADARYMPATQSTTGALGGIAARRKSVARRNAELFRISPIAPGASLPIVVEASARDADLAAWISTRRGLVENLLLKHGAVLFRGFAVSSAAEFRQAAESMTPTLFGDYGDLTRQPASDKVYWATRYPKDEPILPHNESSHLHHWPLRIWFYCMTAAARGGETPLFDCREVFRRLDPEIIERFRAKGLLYKRHFANHLDVTWQNFYRTSERSKVEECCRASGTQFDWTSNGLRTAQRAPAVTRHPQTGESLFFNQILLHHVSMLPRGVRQSLQALFSEEDLPRNVYYGDGLRIEDDVVMEIRAVYDAAANSFPWQEMDVLIVDNMLTAHGRNPFSGTRKVMVAMGNMIGSDSLTHPMDILPPPAELNLRGE